MNGCTAVAPPLSTARRTRQAAQFGLEVMLMQAGSDGPPRFLAPGAAVRVGEGLARRPRRIAARTGHFVEEFARTAVGRSQLAPARGDRRFTDPAWHGNWGLRRLLQGYLAVQDTVDGLITDAQVDWRTQRKARLDATNVVDALAPTNFPWSNPAVIKEIVNTGGDSNRDHKAQSKAPGTYVLAN